MKVIRTGKNTYRKANWFERHDILCSSLVAIVVMAVFWAALFI